MKRARQKERVSGMKIYRENTKLHLKEEEDELLPARPASHKGGLHMTTSPLLYHTADTPQSEKQYRSIVKGFFSLDLFK